MDMLVSACIPLPSAHVSTPGDDLTAKEKF